MFQIRTRRLILRDLVPGDARRLHVFFADPMVTRTMGYIKTRNLRETRALVKRAIFHNRARPRFSYSLAVVRKADRDVVGWIGFGSAEKRKLRIGERDFGYAFRRDQWNRGYGTESLRGITEFIFRKLQGRSFFGESRVRNPASGRVMEKCGFRRLPRRVRGMDPGHRCYLLTREVWRKRNGRVRT